MMRNADLKNAIRALPLRGLNELAPGTSAILAPHPDDESLGCGGLIAALCAAGRPPFVLLVTDGSLSHPGSRRWPAARLAATRAAELRAAAAILDLPPARIIPLGFADSAAPHTGAEFEAASARLADFVTVEGIATLFATSTHDPHGDHVATARLAEAVARKTGVRHMAYPVWFWLAPEEAPAPQQKVHGARLDIAAHLEAKRRAIAAHRSQHGGLITDDPNGFALPSALLAASDLPYEAFIEPPRPL